MAGMRNNPNYISGYHVGKQVVKHIELTTYGTLENALERKIELVKDLKEQFGWDDTHPEVAETLGIISALEEAKVKADAEKPEEVLSLEDITSVAGEIGKLLSEEDTLEILAKYPEAQEQDPSATWNLVVEQLIHEL